MRSILGTLLCVSFFGIAGQARADDASVRKSLTANYLKISEAFRKNDIAAIANLMTPDYVAVQPKGKKLSHDEVLTSLSRQRQVLVNVDWQRKIGKLTVKGNEAVATIQSRMAGIMADPNGKHHNILMMSSSKDTWVKAGAGWKLKSYQFLTGAMALDGKKLAPEAIGK